MFSYYVGPCITKTRRLVEIVFLAHFKAFGDGATWTPLRFLGYLLAHDLGHRDFVFVLEHNLNTNSVELHRFVGKDFPCTPLGCLGMVLEQYLRHICIMCKCGKTMSLNYGNAIEQENNKQDIMAI